MKGSPAGVISRPDKISSIRTQKPLRFPGLRKSSVGAKVNQSTIKTNEMQVNIVKNGTGAAGLEVAATPPKKRALERPQGASVYLGFTGNTF
jgi:hypothetical protein